MGFIKDNGCFLLYFKVINCNRRYRLMCKIEIEYFKRLLWVKRVTNLSEEKAYQALFY